MSNRQICSFQSCPRKKQYKAMYLYIMSAGLTRILKNSAEKMLEYVGFLLYFTLWLSMRFFVCFCRESLFRNYGAHNAILHPFG